MTEHPEGVDRALRATWGDRLGPREPSRRDFGRSTGPIEPSRAPKVDRRGLSERLLVDFGRFFVDFSSIFRRFPLRARFASRVAFRASVLLCFRRVVRAARANSLVRG